MHQSTILLFIFCLFQFTAAQQFPCDLLDKIRFHHLQENFYAEEGEDLLRQAEVYMAQDLVESIEELSFVVGVTTNMRYLPSDRITHFTLSGRIEAKYRHIPYNQLIWYLTQHAHRIFERQYRTSLSAIALNELENDWLEWYRGVLQSIG